MNGGGNISASPDAPQKWIQHSECEKGRSISSTARMRVRAAQSSEAFVFAGLAGSYLGGANAAVVSLDGDVASQHQARMAARSAQGMPAMRARRLDMLVNPAVLVARRTRPGGTRERCALGGGRAGGRRHRLPSGETLTLALDAASGSSRLGPVDGRMTRILVT